MNIFNNRKPILLGLAACMLISLFSYSAEKITKSFVTKRQLRTIRVDGSATVGPITQAAASKYMREQPDVIVQVGVSGTKAGMEKFIANQIDIVDASRPISDDEKAEAQQNGVDYTELIIAKDGISIIANPQNTWANDITVEELNKIFRQRSMIRTWKDIRPQWPAEPIILYSPNTNHGTFEYFLEKVMGENQKMRGDTILIQQSNNLVDRVAEDKGALGFIGHGSYELNKNKLKVLKLNNIEPTFETIKLGTYPLSRPLFIYVNNEVLKEEEVKNFVQFYLQNAKEVVQQAGYIPLDEQEYEQALEMIE